MRGLLAIGLLANLVTCGALGDPYLPTEVPFAEVARQHFDALAVLHERESPSTAPLRVHVHVIGAPTDGDAVFAEAASWLETHANVLLVEDPNGAPLFFTDGDLAATSGRGTLGATVPKGMAVEVRDPRVAPCVLAHEVLHFAGLKHVKDRDNIMYLHCSRDFLETAEITDSQLEKLATLDTIRATTPTGVVIWASR